MTFVYHRWYRRPMAADGENWVLLREASAQTGASMSALRKWYRSEVIESRTVDGPHGPQKQVRLDQVARRMAAWTEGTTRSDPEPPAPPPPSTPTGMVLVPLAAWQQTLESLAAGMAAIHEAGRDLAETRAAQAVAETTAAFLKVQLEEVRTELRHRVELDQDIGVVPETVRRRGFWHRSA